MRARAEDKVTSLERCLPVRHLVVVAHTPVGIVLPALAPQLPPTRVETRHSVLARGACEGVRLASLLDDEEALGKGQVCHVMYRRAGHSA